MVYFGLVKVKMLPFDNKSEFQVILNMPEGSTLEQTSRVALEMAETIKQGSGRNQLSGLYRHGLTL